MEIMNYVFSVILHLCTEVERNDQSFLNIFVFP